MKYNVNVTSDRRKNRKAHFTADSATRAKLMCAPLAKDQQSKYGVKSMPIRKEDRVRIVRGVSTGSAIEGKVTRVYRKKFVINVDRHVREKTNGQQVPIGVHPSNVVITQLKMDKDRKAKLDAKKASMDAHRALKEKTASA